MYSNTTSTIGNSAPLQGAIAVSMDQELKRECVLLVDDSATVRKMFSVYLSPKFECFEAESFDEAIQAIRTQEFAVVVTDIIMPGMSGIELLRKVVEEFSNIEVIVASSVDRPQRALDAIRLGAFDYLIKPCDPTVLQVTVERALERRNLVLNASRYKLELEAQNAELVSRKEQLERLQEQVIQSEKMASIGQLAAGIAHELNNPVGFVHANMEVLDQVLADLIHLIKFYDGNENSPKADLIKKQIGYPEILDDITSIVQDCREGSDRIRNIVQNLKTFSRLDEADYKQTNIHQGIDATIRLLSPYFSTGTVKLSRDFESLPEIGAFAGPLNQVWMNLLVNAAQSIGPESGEVSVRTRCDHENVFVEVSDTGCGIAVQHLKKIFDPFYPKLSVRENERVLEDAGIVPEAAEPGSSFFVESNF